MLKARVKYFVVKENDTEREFVADDLAPSVVDGVLYFKRGDEVACAFSNWTWMRVKHKPYEPPEDESEEFRTGYQDRLDAIERNRGWDAANVAVNGEPPRVERDDAEVPERQRVG